jgi:DNA-binding response OmpR family regulator
MCFVAGASMCLGRPVMRDRKILVVEDDALIAMELGERLAEMGFAVLGPAMTLEAAERAVAEETPDAALLDANVAGLSSTTFGAMLADRGVPIAFCTGYDRIDLPPQIARAPVLTKPVCDADLRACLEALLP